MKWELDDTTSDGIQFLLVGTGSLLLLRLLYAGVLMLMGVPDGDELGAAIAEFRSGYWISDTDVLVSTSSSIGTRLALAVSSSLIMALLLAGAVYQLALLAGKETIRPWSTVLRIALVATLAWSLFAALLLPPCTATLNERGLTVTQRPALFGVLSLPWTARTVTTPWSAVEAIEVSSSEEGHTVQAATKDGTVNLYTGEQAHAERLARGIRERYLVR
ncbi:MAG: hypothetical protein JNM62_00180 [Flavobacteriales bacterium]|nr:hypothetical protein [Flavobacteriales bacterium]